MYNSFKMSLISMFFYIFKSAGIIFTQPHFCLFNHEHETANIKYQELKLDFIIFVQL